jgi:hypothetical protein
MTQLSTGGYVRHRDRMVAVSVFDDLKNTLIACRWMSGTTTRQVVDPYDRAAGWQILTTDQADILPLLGKREQSTARAEIVLIDYFPEASGADDGENPTGAQRSRKTEINTFAVDQGEPGEALFGELGSNFQLQPYIFSMAFYAESDAVALAVMNDLRDRYFGRLVSDDHIDLLDYNQTGFVQETAAPVVRMEIENFSYELAADQTATNADVHLYYARLDVTDYVDAAGPQ